MFLENAKKHSINIISGIFVEKIEKNTDKFIIFSGKKSKEYDKIILATGGNSQNLNSGYDLAQKIGHTITDLKPSLTALQTKENFVAKIAGVSAKNTEISSFFNNKQIIKTKGDFIFTHKGLSGPVIFKTSAYCCYLGYSKDNPLILKINFLPDITKEILEKELLTEFNLNPHKSLDNILKKYLPKSLSDALLTVSEVNINQKACQISKEDRKKILKFLTETELTIISPEPEGEIVTAGGICLNEINPKTMESKLVKGLYFCGEIMDIDGLTGGFNLQACWSTGYIAGLSIIKPN
jgi:hypothetical protein